MPFNQDITLQSVEVYPLNAKGGVSPNMALGLMPVRPALLVKLTSKDGCFGWGEIWANFPARANIHKAHLVEDVLAPKMIGARFAAPTELIELLRTSLSTYFLHIGQCQVFEHLLAGIDCAAWDLALRASGRSFPEAMDIATHAPSYASSLNREDLDRRFEDHAAAGHSEFKLKIGFGEREDMAFVETAMAKKPAGTKLMVDSNQSWSLDRAKRRLADLDQFGLMFAEEPIRADSPLKDWEELASATSIPLAGGENFYGIERFCALGNAGVKVLQPDVAKWGGVSGALELAKKMPAGCSLWPHFMGSAIGQEVSLCVSAAIGQGSKCEMDVNENALRSDLSQSALEITDGSVALLDAPGLIHPPKPDALKRYLVAH